MLKRHFLLAIASLFAATPLLGSSPLFAQGITTQETPSPVSNPQDTPANAPWLESIAEQLKSEFHLPGVWVAANMEDQVEAAAVGVRNTGAPDVSATLNDKLTIASISKPMANLWLATLVDAGRLSYNTRVLDVLPELQESCLPEHRDITLGQLITHTAGVARDAKGFSGGLRLDQYPAERLLQARSLLSAPGPPESKGKPFYSNNGLTLAATMAERVAGESYEVAATRFYRERLGLQSWGVWPMISSEPQGTLDDQSLPWPHRMQGIVAVPQSPQTVAFHFSRPSGSAHCTITDLVRFGLLATNATTTAETILTPQTWSTLEASAPNNGYTLTGLYKMGGGAGFTHGGSLGTTNSNLVVVPAWGVAVAVHTNAMSPTFGKRGTDLVLDAIRKQRAKQNPPPASRMMLNDVETVDASWKNAVVPRTTDDKLRIRVRFRIEAQGQTGDLQTVVKLGDVERRDDRFLGLAPGNHTLHFEFDTPKTKSTPITIALDALGTAGNRAVEDGYVETTLIVND